MFSTRPPLGSWFNQTGTTSADPRGITAADQAGASLDTPQGAAAYADKWDQYVQQIQAGLAASSGFEHTKLQAELENAEKGRANAYKIAQLQANASKYGNDLQYKSAMAQLKENARQFDATHGLEMQKLGLNYAQTATEYLSTPDRFFQASDFIGMAGRALGRTTDGSQGPQPYLANGMPIPKNEGDFAALAGYTMPTPNGGGGEAVKGSASPYPISGGAAGVPSAATDAGTAAAAASAGTPSAVQAAAGQGAGQDARAKALKAMIDAVPPSGVAGLDNNDFAVLQAAKALYSTNLAPGTVERMRPGQQKIMGSAGRRLGIDVDDYLADYQSAKPWQRAARAY